LSPTEIRSRFNGAGPEYIITIFGRKIDIGAWSVPDRMWGQRMTPAFYIHDYMYDIGIPKLLADTIMLLNLLTLIHNSRSPLWLKILRSYRAMTYYLAVYYGGNDAYLNGK
jgi:hypothetical protein